MRSLAMIATYIQWGLGIGTAVVCFRIVYTIFSMVFSFDESISFSAIMVKVGKQIKAAIFMVAIVSITAVIKSYLIH